MREYRSGFLVVFIQITIGLDCNVCHYEEKAGINC
jgi:hypothetical protein